MTFKTSWISWALGLAVVSAGTPLVAHAAKVNSPNPCQKDAEKFCKDVPAGRGNISRCLKQHDAELSVSCKSKHEELKKKMQVTRDACMGDMNKFCKDAKGARGGAMGCLAKHENELSVSCKSARATMRSRVRMRPATPPTS